MLPIKDLGRKDHHATATKTLVALNVVVFMIQWLAWLGGRQHTLIYHWGVVPRCYVTPSACGISVPGEAGLLWKPLFASMFLHGDVLHLAFNMVFLGVFGAGLEHRVGWLRFLAIYLGCGLAASLAQIISNPFSTAAVIGASGAIAGVLGAYLILLPRNWVLTYVPPIFLFPVPAPVFLVLWIAAQLLHAVAHLPLLTMNRQGDNIAWWAHIGGFAAGAAIAWTIAPWWRKRAS